MDDNDASMPCLELPQTLVTPEELGLRPQPKTRRAKAGYVTLSAKAPVLFGGLPSNTIRLLLVLVRHDRMNQGEPLGTGTNVIKELGMHRKAVTRAIKGIPREWVSVAWVRGGARKLSLTEAGRKALQPSR